MMKLELHCKRAVSETQNGLNIRQELYLKQHSKFLSDFNARLY